MNSNFSYNNVIDKLNNIFLDFENIIKNDVEKVLNIKTRNRDTSFIDAMLYKFQYSIPDTTKQSIVSGFNFENNKTTDRRSFDYREKQISINIYKNLFNKVVSLYKKLENIDDKKPIKIAVDGTNNNTNMLNKKDNLETTLNMGFYDLTNDLPIELSIEGNKNKNNELLLLKQYIKNNNIPKNSIFILDRFYCSYDFINFLVDNNYKFIIRFRNNCKKFNKITDIKNIRILKYFDEYDTIIPFEKYDNYVNGKKEKGKYKKINKDTVVPKQNIKFKSANIKMKYEYTLVTNLQTETYKDEKIKELYKERWDIEVFFKLVKYNFKFEHLKEHNDSNTDDDYKKLYLVNLTIIYLSKIIEKTHFYNNDIKKEVIVKENNKIIKYSNKPNKSLTVKGVYKILTVLFNGSLTVKKFTNICKNYVLYSLTKKGLMKERKAKTPFLKWYVKGHSNRSLLYKIIEAKLKKDTSKLNKNHMVLYNICSVIINY
jgi:hypothetical protein